MRGARADRLCGFRRWVLALVAGSIAAISLASVLSATAGAQATCPAGNFDQYTATSGDWSVGTNWSLLAPPSGTEVACWDAGTTVTVSDGESVDSIQADGDLDVVSGGVLALTSSTDDSTVGDLSLEGGGELDGPDVTSAPTLTVEGSFDWGGSGTGVAALDNNATVPGSNLAITTGSLTVDGTTSTPEFLGGSITIGSPVSITNANFETANAPTLSTTSTITLGSGVDIGGTGGATFAAAGVVAGTGTTGTYGFGSDSLVLTGGATTVSGGNTLASGPLTVQGGTVQDDGTVDPSSMTLTGGTLDGTGTVDGPVRNTSGTVSPGDGAPGVLSIGGTYEQDSGGTLVIELTGYTTPGTDFSQLTVSGTATLGGDLSLTDTGSAPATGSTFEILTYGSGSSGTFNLSGPSAGTYLPAYGGSGVTLTALVPPANCPSGSDVFTPTSGNSGEWNGGGTWLPAVPGSGSIACWSTGTTVTLSSGDETVASVQGGALDINGGELTLDSATAANDSVISTSTNAPGGDALSLSDGGNLGGLGQRLTVDGGFDWDGTSGGATRLNDGPDDALKISQTTGAGLTIEGAAAWGGGSISTASPVTISGSDLTDTGAPVLNANAGVTFDTADLAASSSPGTITAPTITTTGATSSVLGFALHLTTGASSLAGTLNVEDLITDAGTTLTVPAGVALNAGSGAISGAITGAGTFTAASGGSGTTVIENGGDLSTAGVDLGGGGLTVDGDAAYDAAIETTIGSGTLDLRASGTTGNLSLTGGGELNGSDGNTLAVTGLLGWSGGGTINAGGGDLAIAQTGAGFSISGTGTPSVDGGSLTTTSPVSITSTHFDTSGAPILTTTSTITLGSGVDIGGTGGATFTAAGVNATGTGAQTYGFGGNSLVLTGGATTVPSGSTLTSGALTVQGGTVQDDGTVDPSSTTLTGGTLDGTGTVDHAVTNASGTVSPGDGAPGVLSVGGTSQQDSGGTLAIELDGTTAGSGFSQLRVGGTTSLKGDLALTDGSGFIPEPPADTFEIISSSSSLGGAFTLTGSGAGSYAAVYDSNDVTLEVNRAPGSAVAPAITGTPSVGQTLSCSEGKWSAYPTAFTYQWNRDGSPISGATGQTYLVVAADRGDSLTCTVTAANEQGSGDSATSSGVSVPAPPAPPPVAPPAPGAPTNTVAPTVTGTPTPGNTLSCSRGIWTAGPTAFKYQWDRNGLPIAGATGATSTVQIAEEGSPLTCTVTALTAAGAGRPKTSAAIIVAEPGTLSCPKPTGRLGGGSLGPLALGFTRARAHRKLSRYSAAGSVEDFCLYGGWGVHAGYPSSKLLRSLSASERGRVTGRIVLALTSNPFYALNGARPGMRLSAVAKRLKVGKSFHIGRNYWYIAAGTAGQGVLRVRGGIIQEIGIASLQLTHGRAAQQSFLTSFSGA